MPMQHAEAALRIGNFLSADAADSFAHVAIDDAAQQRHAGGVVHTIADEHLRVTGQCNVNKTIDFLGTMLTIGVEDKRPGELSIQPVTKSGLDRSEEHTSELQSQFHLVCRLLLEKKKKY